MKLQITTRHFDMTPDLRSYAEERVRKIKRYFDHIIEVNVILTTEKHRQVAEVTLHLNGTDLVGTAESGEMKMSVDQAVARIEAQLKRHKGRLTDRKGRTSLGAALGAETTGPSGVDIEDDAEA
jgi:putative sigma-54 modulation protein